MRGLYGHFAARYTFLTEVPAIGFREGLIEGQTSWWERGAEPEPGVRFIDVLLIGQPSTKPAYERIAIEVKVSRADYFRDTADKRKWWQSLSHRFAYAVPAGLVTKDEVPPGCGLIEVERRRQTDWGYAACKWTVRAPRRTEQPEPFSAYMAHYFARRASFLEAKAKGLSYEARQQEDDPDVLRRLLHEERLARTAADRRLDDYRMKRASAADLLSALEPQVCVHCAATVKPRVGRGSSYLWAHVDKAVGEACRQAWETREAERYLAAREAAPGLYAPRGWYDVRPACVDLLDIDG